MRAGLLFAAFLAMLGSSSVAGAIAPCGRVVVASFAGEPLPLRGTIFIDPLGALPQIRWLKGHGDTAFARAGIFVRIDYTASDDSMVDIDGVWYRFSSSSHVDHASRFLSIRDDGPCGTIALQLDGKVAALRARLTRGERVEDYWLVGGTESFELVPTCDPSDVPLGSGTLQIFATLADGRASQLGGPLLVAQIPIRGRHAVREESVDPRIGVSLALLALVALVGAFVRPRVALHGVTRAGYLSKLRFRVRLPPARIHRR